MTVKELEKIGTIREIEIHKRKNAHTICKVKLLLEDDIKVKQLKKYIGTKVCVEDESRIYLRGTVREISCDCSFSGSKAVISIVSFSDLADRKARNRVYQNTEKKMEDIFGTLNFGDARFQISGLGFLFLLEPKVIVQQEETDFAFAVRMAESYGGSVLINDTDQKACITIGKNSGIARKDLNPQETILYHMEVDQKKECLHITSREYLELGQETVYEGQNYVAASVDVLFQDDMAHFHYVLERELGQPSHADYFTGWLGRARVINTKDPENYGRIQVEFLEYEDSASENRIWIPYLPVLTEKEQGMVLIPGIDEIVSVFCQNGICYANGCIRETKIKDRISDVDNRTLMFGDKCFSFEKEKLSMEAFDNKIVLMEKEIQIYSKDSAISLNYSEIEVKEGGSKINVEDGKISVKTKSFDIG